MGKRNLGEVITMFLVEGYLDEDDILPVLKKGTAKMTGEKEEKIFTQPLQNESEWEQKINELVAYAVGGECGGRTVDDCKKELIEAIATAVSNRENEIAEEVKKKINSAGGLGGWKHLDDILNEIILKH